MTQHQHSFTFDHKPSYSYENFLVSDSNREAFDYINSWPKWSDYISILTGPKGSGKKHLSSLWIHQSKAVDVTKEVLSNYFDKNIIQPVYYMNLSDYDLKTAGSLTLKEEENILHFYNLIKENKSYLLVSALHPPSGWAFKIADLQSRLRATYSISIKPIDDDLITSIYIKLFSDKQIKVTPQIIAYLSRYNERSFDSIQNTVNLLDKISLEEQRPISLKMIKENLKR